MTVDELRDHALAVLSDGDPRSIPFALAMGVEHTLDGGAEVRVSLYSHALGCGVQEIHAAERVDRAGLMVLTTETATKLLRRALAKALAFALEQAFPAPLLRDCVVLG